MVKSAKEKEEKILQILLFSFFISFVRQFVNGCRPYFDPPRLILFHSTVLPTDRHKKTKLLFTDINKKSIEFSKGYKGP